MPTGVVARDSELVRKGWLQEGLITKASESIFAPFIGSTKESIVYLAKNGSASEGHTVVFDFKGNLAGRAVKGKEQAVGKGEQKRKFSDKLTVEKYRLVVDNGDVFDAVDINDLSVSQHSDSRSGLADLYTRFKDQALIDAAQGNLGSAPTHIIDLGTTFTVNQLTDIMTTLKTGKGFDTGSKRRPPEPFKMENGKKMWIFAADADMIGILKKDSTYQTLVYNADVRGNNNAAIQGIVGKMGNLLIVEWDQFFGKTDAGASWGLNASNIELAGLRQFDSVNSAWSGQPDFDPASTLRSRGLIMGAGAIQYGMGKQPDYKMESYDFGAKTESAVEFWMEAKKTNMTAEMTDYDEAKIAGIDWGVIAVDLTVQA